MFHLIFVDFYNQLLFGAEKKYWEQNIKDEIKKHDILFSCRYVRFNNKDKVDVLPVLIELQKLDSIDFEVNWDIELKNGLIDKETYEFLVAKQKSKQNINKAMRVV